MTVFFLLAASLVVLALLFLLPSLLRPSADDASISLRDANITVARERMAALRQALNDGSLDAARFDQERDALERELGQSLAKSDSDGESDAATRAAASRPDVVSAIVLLAAVPIAAGALYLYLGNPSAIGPVEQMAVRGPAAGGAGTASAEGGAPPLDELIPRLEAHLAENPDDLRGLRLLARTYMMMGDYPQAVGSFERLLEQSEPDVDVLAQYAETLAMLQDGMLAGKPLEVLETAQSLDPEHKPTRWLLALSRQQAGDHQEAIALFDSLRSADDTPEVSDSITAMINQSRQALGLPMLAADAGVASAETDTDSSTPEAPANVILARVTLGEEATAGASAEQTVFVFARASTGPPMPLAAARLSVSDLPATVRLDRSMAMIEGRTLDDATSVTVGARISPSGNPIAQPGDWMGELSDIALPGNGEPVIIDIVIDQQAP